MARYKDGADQDHKDAKRLAPNVRAGHWRVAGGQNTQAGRSVEAPGTDQLEGGAGSRPGNYGGLSEEGPGEKSEPATRGLLGWGKEFKVGDIGFAIFGSGLHKCDSV